MASEIQRALVGSTLVPSVAHERCIAIPSAPTARSLKSVDPDSPRTYKIRPPDLDIYLSLLVGVASDAETSFRR